MTITLANIEEGSLLLEAATLAFAGVAVTIFVYGSVALIVKMDDIGLWLAQNGLTGISRGLGRGMVKGMPKFLKALTIIGTAAMLWVGSSIIVHGLDVLGWSLPYKTIHEIAVAVAGGSGFLEWAVTAFLDGILGLVVGMALIPAVTRVLAPLSAGLFGGASTDH